MPVLDKWAEKWGFETFGDQELVKALREAVDFIEDLRAGGSGRWLTLAGPCGVGKTFLASKVWRWFDRFGKFYTEPFSGAQLSRSGQKVLFGQFVEECRGGDYSRRVDLKEDHFVVLDDLGAENDKTSFVGELAFGILNARIGKWTLITTNLPLAALAKWDERVASRMVRDGNRFVWVKSQDYGIRTYQK